MNINFISFPYVVEHVSHDRRRVRNGLVFPLRRGDRPLAEVIPLPVQRTEQAAAPARKAS